MRTTQPVSAMEEVAAEEAEEEKTEGIFSDVSFSAAIASGLAAVTSLVMANKIGIAGSVIGTAVAAAATTIANAVYRRILTKSAEKIRDLDPSSNAASNATAADAHDRPQTATGTVAPAATPSTTMRRTATIDVATRRATTARAGTRRVMTTETVPQASSVSGTPIAPQGIRRAAASKHAKDIRRRMVAFSIVVALIALLVTAGIIMLATAGKGIGTTTTEPTSISLPSSTDSERSVPLTAPSDEEGPDATTEESATAQDPQENAQGTASDAESTTQDVQAQDGSGSSTSSSDAQATGSSSTSASDSSATTSTNTTSEESEAATSAEAQGEATTSNTSLAAQGAEGSSSTTKSSTASQGQ